MKTSTYIMAVAAAALASAPALAAPTNPASTLSVAKSVRASGTVKRDDKLAGTGLIIALLAAAGVVAGIVIVATDKNSVSR